MDYPISSLLSGNLSAVMSGTCLMSCGSSSHLNIKSCVMSGNMFDDMSDLCQMS